MSQNVHITHIDDTFANILTNIDELQYATANDSTAALPYEELVWSNNDLSYIYAAAAQKRYDVVGGTWERLDAEFSKLESYDTTDGILTAQWLRGLTDTDTRIEWNAADQLRVTVGGVEFIQMVEGATDYIAIDPLVSGVEFRLPGATQHSPYTTDRILALDGSGIVGWIDASQIAALIGTVDGTGTAGYVAGWQDTDTIEDAPMRYSGTEMAINGAVVSGNSLTIHGTTPDLVLYYDGSNYATLQSGNAGALSIDCTGSAITIVKTLQLSSVAASANSNGGFLVLEEFGPAVEKRTPAQVIAELALVQHTTLNASYMPYASGSNELTDTTLLYNPTTGKYSIGSMVASDTQHLYVSGTSDIDGPFSAVESNHIKTSGTSTFAHDFYGLENFLGVSQGGGVVGTMAGIYNTTTLTTGTVGDPGTNKNLYGIYNFANIDSAGVIYGVPYASYQQLDTSGTASLSSDLINAYYETNVNCAVPGALSGLNIVTDIEGSSADITDSVYGILNTINFSNGSIGNDLHGLYSELNLTDTAGAGVVDNVNGHNVFIDIDTDINGSVFGCRSRADITGPDGDVAEDLVGGYLYARIADGIVQDDLKGAYLRTVVAGGTVSSDVFGIHDSNVVTAGTVAGNLYGALIRTDIQGGTVTGTVYGIFLDADTGTDFGIDIDSSVATHLRFTNGANAVDFTNTAGDLIIDVTGNGTQFNQGIGIGSAPVLNYGIFNGINFGTTGDTYGYRGVFSKTSGASDENDDYYMTRNTLTYSQFAGVVGDVTGDWVTLSFFGGDVGTAVVSKNVRSARYQQVLSLGTYTAYGEALGIDNEINFSSGTVTGNLRGLYNKAYITGAVTGGAYLNYNYLQAIAGSTVGSECSGNTTVIDLDAGSAAQIIGQSINIDQEAAHSVTNDVFGYYAQAALDGSVGGASYGLYVTGDWDQLAHLGDGTDNSHFETDGTLVFEGAATVWDDLRVPVSSLARIGNTDPDWEQFQDDGAGSIGVYALAFASNTDQEVYFTAQMPHSWKEGSTITPHVHWSPSDGNAGNVTWKLEYTWQSIDGTFGTTSTVSVTASTTSTALKHIISDMTTISGAGETISSMLICRLYRDVSDGDTYGSDAFLLEFDFHYEIDTVGSRQISTK